MRTIRTVRRAGPVAAIALVVALAACAPFKSSPSPNPVAGQLYAEVNNARAANGLPPLAWNDQLAGLAQGWSGHIASTGDFSHQNLGALLGNPALAGFSGLAKNIMRGTCGMSAAEIHQHWMSSPLHRANILGSYSAIGISVACSGGTVAAAEDFGR
jgi:uncharacterized protein YkwD